MSGAAKSIIAGSAFVKIAMDNAELKRGIKQSQTNIQRFVSNVNVWGEKVGLITAALSLPFSRVIEAFSEFDQRMRLVQAVTQSSEKAFNDLKATAREFGRQMSFTTQQVAETMVVLGRMGFNADEIKASTQPIMQLAMATGDDLALAARVAGNNLRVFQKDVKDISKVTDIILATVNGSAQGLEDFSDASAKAGPSFQVAGQSIETMSAAIGVLANMGIRGSLAGTSLARALRRLANPEVQAYLRQYGIDISKDVREGVKFQDMLVKIARVMATIPRDQRIAMTEKIFEVRGAYATLPLTVNTKAIDDVMLKIDNSKGLAQQSAKEIEAGFYGTLMRLKSAFNDVFIAIGEVMSISLVQKVESIAQAINDLNKQSESVKYFFSVFINGYAGLSLLGVGFKALTMTMYGIKTVFAPLQKLNALIVGTAAAQKFAQQQAEQTALKEAAATAQKIASEKALSAERLEAEYARLKTESERAVTERTNHAQRIANAKQELAASEARVVAIRQEQLARGQAAADESISSRMKIRQLENEQILQRQNLATLRVNADNAMKIYKEESKTLTKKQRELSRLQAVDLKNRARNHARRVETLNAEIAEGAQRKQNALESLNASNKEIAATEREIKAIETKIQVEKTSQQVNANASQQAILNEQKKQAEINETIAKLNGEKIAKDNVAKASLNAANAAKKRAQDERIAANAAATGATNAQAAYAAMNHTSLATRRTIIKNIQASTKLSSAWDFVKANVNRGTLSFRALRTAIASTGVAMSALKSATMFLINNAFTIALIGIAAAYQMISANAEKAANAINGTIDVKTQEVKKAEEATDALIKKQKVERDDIAYLVSLQARQVTTAKQQKTAIDIISKLTGKYKDLGVSINKTTGEIRGAELAQKNLNDAQREELKGSVQKQIAEQERVLKESIKAQAVNANSKTSFFDKMTKRGYSNNWRAILHMMGFKVSGTKKGSEIGFGATDQDLWSLDMSGGINVFRERVASAYETAKQGGMGNDIAAVKTLLDNLDKLIQLRKQYDKLNAGGSVVQTDEDAPPIREAITKPTEEEVNAAKKKIEEMSESAARQRMNAMSREIADVEKLREEYKRLMQTLVNEQKAEISFAEDTLQNPNLRPQDRDAAEARKKAAQEEINALGVQMAYQNRLYNDQIDNIRARGAHQRLSKYKEDYQFVNQYTDAAGTTRAGTAFAKTAAERRERSEGMRYDTLVKSGRFAEAQRYLADLISSNARQMKIAIDTYNKEVAEANKGGYYDGLMNERERIERSERMKAIREAITEFVDRESKLREKSEKVREAKREVAKDSKVQVGSAGSFSAAAARFFSAFKSSPLDGIRDNTEKTNNLLSNVNNTLKNGFSTINIIE